MQTHIQYLQLVEFESPFLSPNAQAGKVLKAKSALDLFIERNLHENLCRDGELCIGPYYWRGASLV